MYGVLKIEDPSGPEILDARAGGPGSLHTRVDDSARRSDGPLHPARRAPPRTDEHGGTQMLVVCWKQGSRDERRRPADGRIG